MGGGGGGGEGAAVFPHIHVHVTPFVLLVAMMPVQPVAS